MGSENGPAADAPRNGTFLKPPGRGRRSEPGRRQMSRCPAEWDILDPWDIGTCLDDGARLMLRPFAPPQRRDPGHPLFVGLGIELVRRFVVRLPHAIGARNGLREGLAERRQFFSLGCRGASRLLPFGLRPVSLGVRPLQQVDRERVVRDLVLTDLLAAIEDRPHPRAARDQQCVLESVFAPVGRRAGPDACRSPAMPRASA